MLNTPPKELRENIARAKGYLRRDELPRSLQAMATAMRQYSEVRLTRSARAEIDIQLGEFLNTLIRHQGMQHLLDPNHTGKPRKIPYQQGKELMLATVLEGLARILRQEVEDKSRQEKEAQELREQYLDKIRQNISSASLDTKVRIKTLLNEAGFSKVTDEGVPAAVLKEISDLF